MKGGLVLGTRIAALATGLTGVCTSAAWGISPAETIARRQLITQAEAAHEAGQHAQALEFGRRAASIEKTTSLLYFLAREQEEVGALAEGYASAELCKVEAERDQNLHNRDAILQECRQIATRIQGRIGHVVISVSERVPGMKIRVAGQDFNEALLGVPFVVTPGSVAVEATAPGRRPYNATVNVSEGQTADVAVVLSDLRNVICPQGSVQRGTECVPAPEPSAPIAASTREPSHRPLRRHTEAPELRASSLATPSPAAPEPHPAPMVTAERAAPENVVAPRYDLYMAGVGGALLVAGTVVYLVSAGEFSSLKEVCNSDPPQLDCTTTRYNDGISKVQTLDRIAHISWIAGALLVGGGIGHYFWERQSQPRAQRSDLSFDPVTRTLAISARF